MPERQFQVRRIDFAKNPGAHCTSKISTNQRSGNYAVLQEC